MQRWASLLLAIVMAVMLLGCPGAQARVLRGSLDQQASATGTAGPARALLNQDSKGGNDWGSRDWPAQRQVATSSGRGGGAYAAPVMAAGRAYGYQSQNQPVVMSGPIYDNSWNAYRG